MGLQIILDIHQQDDLKLDDLAALNADLMADFHGGFGELYGDFTSDPDWEGPFKIVEGSLRIAENWDGEFSGYGRESPYGDDEIQNSTMVWGCYGENVWKIISKHITAGKLVLHIEIEGNDDEYVIMTPGAYEEKSAGAIRF